MASRAFVLDGKLGVCYTLLRLRCWGVGLDWTLNFGGGGGGSWASFQCLDTINSNIRIQIML